MRVEEKGELREWLVVENLRGATEEEEVEVVNRRELRKGLGELLLLLQKRLMEEDDEGWKLNVHNDMSESLRKRRRETETETETETVKGVGFREF